jgi:murein DD-endopeptidase MepM/ murein hydrolase activator NlpD
MAARKKTTLFGPMAFFGALLSLLVLMGVPAGAGAVPDQREVRTGGIRPPGIPEIRDAVCVSNCVSVRRATRGSVVRVTGSSLERVRFVVFAAKKTRSGRKTVRTRFEKKGYSSVRVRVPKEAAGGRVRVISADGRRSKASPRELKILPRSMIPEEVFPVQGAFSYSAGGGRFGAPRPGRRHQGQDVAAACGIRLVSVRKAKVVRNAWHSAAGYYVVLKNVGTRSSFAYMHLIRKSKLKLGTTVGAGAPVGRVGNTGRSFGCHLHFEFWEGPWQAAGGKPIDPLPYLRSLKR